MKSTRFYAVFTLMLLTVWSVNTLFTGYDLIHAKGLSEDALDDTKYFHLDCGRVILVDRTEEYRDNQGLDIDYYVTYYSPFRDEAHTLSVTPSAYVSAKQCKKNGRNICFSVADASYSMDSMGYTFFWGLMIVAGFVLCCQFYLWSQEEFSKY
jgi:hypothetical protein